MLIHHIATAEDWEAAQETGLYMTSTLGRTLEEEGFIHASRPDQVEAVRATFYADVVEPLVLLTIETERLTSPWREETVGDDSFPHVYGPLTSTRSWRPHSSEVPTSRTTSSAVPHESVIPAPPWP